MIEMNAVHHFVTRGLNMTHSLWNFSTRLASAESRYLGPSWSDRPWCQSHFMIVTRKFERATFSSIFPIDVCISHLSYEKMKLTKICDWTYIALKYLATLEKTRRRSVKEARWPILDEVQPKLGSSSKSASFLIPVKSLLVKIGFAKHLSRSYWGTHSLQKNGIMWDFFWK